MLVKVEEVKIGKNWSRTDGMGDVSELAASLKEHGQITPILIDSEGQLIAGYRRLAAAKELGWDMIEATVREDNDPVINLIENMNRKDLTLWEEIKAIEEVFGAEAPQCEVVKALSKSKTWVKPRLEALKLPKETLEKIRAGQMDIGQLRRRLMVVPSTSRIRRENARPTPREIDQMISRLMAAGRPVEAKALSFAVGAVTTEELFA